MTRAIYILAAFLLLACSPQKKLDNLIRRHPELLTAKDTIIVRDTVFLAGDTMFRPIYLRSTDTITVENERQVIKIVRVPTGSPCDTARIAAHITGIVKPDTVTIEVPVIVEKVAPVRIEKVTPWWMWILIGILCALSAYLAIRPR